MCLYSLHDRILRESEFQCCDKPDNLTINALDFMVLGLLQVNHVIANGTEPDR